MITFKAVIRGAVALFCILSTLAVAERLIWVNADSYPHWLSTPLKVESYPPGVDEKLALIEKVCAGKPGVKEISKKNNGEYMRCDTSLSLTSWHNGVYLLTE